MLRSAIVLVILAVVFVVPFTGCSSSNGCDNVGTSMCPNDPPNLPDAGPNTAAQDCRQKNCNSQAQAIADCIKPIVKCGSDGKTDPASVQDALAKCAQPISAYQTCINMK